MPVHHKKHISDRETFSASKAFYFVCSLCELYRFALEKKKSSSKWFQFTFLLPCTKKESASHKRSKAFVHGIFFLCQKRYVLWKRAHKTDYINSTKKEEKKCAPRIPAISNNSELLLHAFSFYVKKRKRPANTK